MGLARARRLPAAARRACGGSAAATACRFRRRARRSNRVGILLSRALPLPEPTLLPKRKGQLVSFDGLDLNALKFEHTALGSRPAWGGEAADPVACRKDPVARNDQWHRVACHRLTNVACRLRPRAKLLCQCSIGGRVSPSNPTRRFIDFPCEKLLRTEIEFDSGEICLFPVEVVPHRGDNFGHGRWRGASYGTGGATP